MGRSTGNDQGYGIFNFIVQTRMFPSGHIAVNAIIWLIIDKEKPPWLKSFMLAMLILQIVSLLFSRGYCSIDIVGGLMIAYIAYLMRDYLKKIFFSKI